MRFRDLGEGGHWQRFTDDTPFCIDRFDSFRRHQQRTLLLLPKLAGARSGMDTIEIWLGVCFGDVGTDNSTPLDSWPSYSRHLRSFCAKTYKSIAFAQIYSSNISWLGIL